MIALHSIAESMTYIEDHLNEKITMEEIANIAHYSSFHYQRLFQMLTGMTVYDYILSRRLSKASRALLTGHDKIIDLAYEYGYESPEAFTRAFKKFYGMTPSKVRKESIALKYYPKLEIQVQIKAETPLNFKIVDQEALYIKGFKNTFTANEIMKGKAYPRFWSQKRKAVSNLLVEYDTHKQVGAGAYRKDDQNIYDAIVGCFVDDKLDADLIIPPGKWCVFYEKGPISETLHRLWSRIFLEWFPKTSFQHSGQIEIEVFPTGDSNDPEYTYEVWIPLRSVVRQLPTT